MQKTIAVLFVLLLSFTREAGAGEAPSAAANASTNTSQLVVTGNPTAANQGIGNQQALTINGGKTERHQPQPLPASTAQTVVSTGYVSESRVAHSAAVGARELDDYYQQLARPAVQGGRKLPRIRRKSTTEDTLITFVGHQNLFWLPRNSEQPDIEMNMSGVATLIPVGILNAQVAPKILKEGYSVNQSSVFGDSVNDLVDEKEFRGLGKLQCLGHPWYFGGGYGQRVMGDGKSLQAAANFFGLFNAGGGISTADGLNFPVNATSVACIMGVPAKEGDPGAVVFDVRPEAIKAVERKAAEEARAAAEAAAKAQMQTAAAQGSTSQAQ